MKAVSEIRKQQHTEARGEKTRQDILQAAVHVASAEGLEGLTIGRLADELRMSKSGLFAHFGSKEELQLAVVSKARDIFVQEVVDPAFKRERGLVRLLAMLDEWLAYVGRSVFRGGCFFMASAIEFDSSPPITSTISSNAVSTSAIRRLRTGASLTCEWPPAACAPSCWCP